MKSVNIKNLVYVVHLGDIHLIKPRISASKVHVIQSVVRFVTRKNPDDVVLVTDTWRLYRDTHNVW